MPLSADPANPECCFRAEPAGMNRIPALWMRECLLPGVVSRASRDGFTAALGSSTSGYRCSTPCHCLHHGAPGCGACTAYQQTAGAPAAEFGWVNMRHMNRPPPTPSRRWVLWPLTLALAAQCTPAAQGTPIKFEACVDYHCDRQRPVVLDEPSWQQVVGLFIDSDSARAERVNIARGIALMERLVGQRTGTWQDRPRNSAGTGQTGQLDCIAESINTTTYLRLLEQAGLLRWHSVEKRIKRQRWLVAIHWTAVIRAEDTDLRYAVDSWYGDNGALPLVQPLSDWREGLPAAQLPVHHEDRASLAVKRR